MSSNPGWAPPVSWSRLSHGWVGDTDKMLKRFRGGDGDGGGACLASLPELMLTQEVNT